MTEYTAEALRGWFKRVEPIYPELFNAAHAICGNYDQAEDALRSGILEVWTEDSEGSMGFRERLRTAVREEALRLCRQDEGGADFTWPGLNPEGSNPVLRQAAREGLETQRLLMLKAGLGLSPGRIALVTGLPASFVKTTLKRFDARCRRSLPARDRGRYDVLLSRAMRQQLQSRSGLPQPKAIYRAFEAEASNFKPRTHRISRVIYRIAVLVMALICAALFWLFAVLVQPPELQTQVSTPEDAQTVTTFQVE